MPHDPSVEEMRDIVVLREIRPELEERWNRNEVQPNIPVWACEGGA